MERGRVETISAKSGTAGHSHRAALTGISSTYTRSILKSQRRLAPHESKSMTQ